MMLVNRVSPIELNRITGFMNKGEHAAYKPSGFTWVEAVEFVAIPACAKRNKNSWS